MRISNSFSEGEIQVMDFILSTLLRGGTPSMAVRSKDFASLCRKVQSMKSRAADAKAGGPVKRNAPEQSSVGMIDGDTSRDDASEDLDEVG